MVWEAVMVLEMAHELNSKTEFKTIPAESTPPMTYSTSFTEAATCQALLAGNGTPVVH